MLSRVAERMYWMGRQMERTEDTARMLTVNINLLLDSNLDDVDTIWRRLISITGTEPLFNSCYQKRDERNVVKFLLADQNNGSSIISSIRFARENARTTREIIPADVWEQINQLYIFASQHAAESVSRKSRVEFLYHVMPVCQLVAGLVDGTMRHDAAFYFYRLGMMIERADMTSRIVDVGIADTMEKQSRDTVIDEADNNTMWLAVLNSLGASQAFHQYVQDPISPHGVTEFMIKDERFPRAVIACLCEILTCLDDLPQNEIIVREVKRLKRKLDRADVDDLLAGDIHSFIDEIQEALSELHTQIARTWFLPPAAA